MRIFLSSILFSLLVVACVPAKKYNDLLAKEQNCQEELKKYKTAALDKGAALKTAQARVDILEKNISKLKEDTTELGQSYRALNAKYQQALALRESFAKQLEKIKNSDAQHLARMQADLQAKILEVQEKEDALMALENKLDKKEQLLAQREKRVNELEAMIKQQNQAVKALKAKIAAALSGFTGKGLKVENRNGKIYVSMDAKLLFPSGSTNIEAEGKNAIIKLSKAIEDVEDLEIIVEGHTDTDRLVSADHPKNNWELSVLRATAVIDIMLKNSNVDPKILTAAGRSKYHPVDPNNKAKNRRIEVIIAPNLNKLFQIINE